MSKCPKLGEVITVEGKPGKENKQKTFEMALKARDLDSGAEDTQYFTVNTEGHLRDSLIVNQREETYQDGEDVVKTVYTEEIVTETGPIL